MQNSHSQNQSKVSQNIKSKIIQNQQKVQQGKQQTSNVQSQNIKKQQTHAHYSKAQFWDDRYQQNGGFFDWYAQFPQLKYSFQTQYNFKKSDFILMIGCGNSKLSQQMYDEGYKNIINIDISPTVIQQMKKVSPDMEWLVMDATNMIQFQDKKFDIVIDKGTMDALIAGRDLNPSIQLLQQTMRVTKQQGQLILITYGSPQGRKKVFQNALPFNLFDYYFAYVNLNDMSTMINLMRNNLIGPNGEKIQKQAALQRSMKQFMMIKIMRQRRSKDKQFVIWENFIKKVNLQKVNQEQNQKQLQKAQKIQNSQQQKQQSSTQKRQQKQKLATKVVYASKSQKQSFVYAYSIKRKLGYDFNLNQIKNVQLMPLYQGHQNLKNIQIKGYLSIVNEYLAKCVSYCRSKIIAHSTIMYKAIEQPFSADDKFTKINVQKGKQFKVTVLRKANIQIALKFDKINSINKFLDKLMLSLVQNLSLKLHPCPKTYALFSMIKGRMNSKTSNELIKRYWYPTYKISQVNMIQKNAKIILSIPPVYTQILEQIKSQILKISQNNKQLKIQIIKAKKGFISFPQIQLLGIFHLTSLSYNKGQGLIVKMEDFLNCQQKISKQELQNKLQSKYFNIQPIQVQVPQNILHQVMLHLMILY